MTWFGHGRRRGAGLAIAALWMAVAAIGPAGCSSSSGGPDGGTAEAPLTPVPAPEGLLATAQDSCRPPTRPGRARAPRSAARPPSSRRASAASLRPGSACRSPSPARSTATCPSWPRSRAADPRRQAAHRRRDPREGRRTLPRSAHAWRRRALQLDDRRAFAHRAPLGEDRPADVDRDGPARQLPARLDQERGPPRARSVRRANDAHPPRAEGGRGARGDARRAVGRRNRPAQVELGGRSRAAQACCRRRRCSRASASTASSTSSATSRARKATRHLAQGVVHVRASKSSEGWRLWRRRPPPISVSGRHGS